MTNVQLNINGKVNEASFENYRTAKKHFNNLIKELAPNATRKHCSDEHENFKNAIYLMRGRFVEEYVEF